MAQEAIAFYESGLSQNQRLGRVFVMPKTAKGSRAHMQQVYTEVRAIEKECGKATFFVTMTMNPNTADVQRNKKVCQEEVSRLVEKYMTTLASTFGIRWLKNGKPTPESIDHYISAEIPPLPVCDPNLCPMAAADLSSGCTVNGRCKKGFPKPFSDRTVLFTDRPHLYRRRHPEKNNASAEKKYVNRTVIDDNSLVVPHNRFLLETFDCHLNVEYVYGDQAAKYGTKSCAEYLTKDRPHMYIRHERGTSRAHRIEYVDYDEYHHFKKVVHMGPCQAYTCITNFPIVHKSHTVYSLPIHEEGQEPTFFGPGQEAEAARRILEGRGRRSELRAFFELCQVDEYARQFTYLELPKHYWFKKQIRMLSVMKAPRNRSDIQPVIESVLSKKNFDPDEREEYESALVLVLLRMLSLSTYLDVSVRARFVTKEILEPLIEEAEAIFSAQSLPAISTPKWAKKRAAPKSQSTIPKKKNKTEVLAIEHEVGKTPSQTLAECSSVKVTPKVKAPKVVKNKAKQNAQQNLSNHDESPMSSEASGGGSFLARSQDEVSSKRKVKCSKTSYERAMQQALGKQIDEEIKLGVIDPTPTALQTPFEDSNSANRTMPVVRTPKRSIIKSMQQTLSEYLNPKKVGANKNEVLLGRCEKLDKVCEVVAMKMELEEKIKAICEEEDIETSVIQKCYEFAKKKFEPSL
uniref:Helitron helicase-like domain-containing protein n=2 Tax=Ditylenchus dipsaci TaxID=166011 RepID=A0A915ERS0_9BILA